MGRLRPFKTGPSILFVGLLPFNYPEDPCAFVEYTWALKLIPIIGA